MSWMGSQTPADEIFQITKILDSSVAIAPDTGLHDGVLYNVAGIGAVDFVGPAMTPIVADENDGEGDPEGDVFSNIGLLTRPLPPRSPDVRGKPSSGHAEAVCIRTQDGLMPVASRDLRVRMGSAGPGVGCVSVVGYGGGFFSQDPWFRTEIIDDKPVEFLSGTRQVQYCPYGYNDQGEPERAHAVLLDPQDESITIVHGRGASISMKWTENTGTQMVLRSDNGLSSLTVDDSGVTLRGQINLVGPTVLGDPGTAVPLLAGVASPPCSALFLSP